MSTKNMEDFIQSQIEDYLDNSIDIASVLSEAGIHGLTEDMANVLHEEIKDNVDPSVLAKQIVDSIRPMILSYSSYHNCPECKRPIGTLISGGGGELQDGLLMQNGKSILILDDF